MKNLNVYSNCKYYKVFQKQIQIYLPVSLYPLNQETRHNRESKEKIYSTSNTLSNHSTSAFLL